MASKAEMPERFIGQSPNAAEGLVPVVSSGELKVNSSNREVLDPASVEVRFGNPEIDAPRLLELFTHPQIIEHIAGMTPYTTVEKIRELYKDQGLVLLTAETPSGIIIGTITAQKPAFGATAAGVLRLAVDPEYRNKRIGNKLIKTANALIFRDAKDEEYMGLDCLQARASVILGVDGELMAQRAFAREGYIRGAELVGTTRGWSNRFNRLVNQNSQPMTLTRSWYRQNRRGEHDRYFPKQRPTN